MTFPPPQPDDQHISSDPNNLPNDLPHTVGSPRRTASIVALTSGLLVGGLLVGSQFASANTPANPDGSTTPTAPAPEAPDAELFEVHADWLNADGLFELDPEIEAQFEKFDTCMSEQLGDLGDFGDFHVLGDVASVEPLGAPAGVFVEGGDDTGFYEFGDGDGTVTISKVGVAVSVASDGDIEAHVLDIAAGGEIDEQWKAAENACGDLFPDGALGGVFSSGSIEAAND